MKLIKTLKKFLSPKQNSKEELYNSYKTYCNNNPMVETNKNMIEIYNRQWVLQDIDNIHWDNLEQKIRKDTNLSIYKFSRITSTKNKADLLKAFITTLEAS
jgi:hypothetical protein